MAKLQRTISDVVHDIMMSLPETEQVASHGIPTYRVANKTFAHYTINHHGDGRVALNLIAPKGAQELFTKMDSKIYFVPPYTGPKGWLGVNLDQGLDWSTVCEHVHDAYELVAPPNLVDALDRAFKVQPPTRKFRPEEIDPFLGKRPKAILKKLKAICSALPETQPDTQFGAPVWKAGKKTFVTAHYWLGRLKLSFRVGSERQAELSTDNRYEVSPYTGVHGWIDLDVEDHEDWTEIEPLILESYRHFALKRMLKAMEAGD